MEELKSILNEKQYEAVVSEDKYLRIIAGAGSGKTRVLTYRIAHLIQDRNYYPSSILAITLSEFKFKIKLRKQLFILFKLRHVS